MQSVCCTFLQVNGKFRVITSLPVIGDSLDRCVNQLYPGWLDEFAAKAVVNNFVELAITTDTDDAVQAARAFFQRNEISAFEGMQREAHIAVHDVELDGEAFLESFDDCVAEMRRTMLMVPDLIFKVEGLQSEAFKHLNGKFCVAAAEVHQPITTPRITVQFFNGQGISELKKPVSVKPTSLRVVSKDDAEVKQCVNAGRMAMPEKQ